MSLETFACMTQDLELAFFSKTNTWQKPDSAKVWVFFIFGATDSLGYTLSVNSQNSQNSQKSMREALLPISYIHRARQETNSSLWELV